MGKLRRIKLAQNRRSKKVTRHLSHTGTSQPPQSDLPPPLPPIPYIRCGFLQGRAPKVRPELATAPPSPINQKAADIHFPLAAPSPTNSPLTPLPKKWLRLGCDPCKQQRSVLHEEYKLAPRHSTCEQQSQPRRCGQAQILQAPTPEVEELRQEVSFSSKEGRPYQTRRWEQEMSWKVLGKSSEKVVVRKQVVLKKRPASTSSASLSPMRSLPLEVPTVQQQPVVGSDDWLLEESNAGTSSGYASARNSCDSRSEAKREQGGVYKLPAGLQDENDSFYAWEKDVSPFASESSIFTPENRRLSSVSRLSSSSITPVKEDKKLRSPYSRLRKEDQFNWASPSRLLDEFIDTHNSRLEDPEAACRSWDGSSLSVDHDSAESWMSPRQGKSCRQHDEKFNSMERELEIVEEKKPEHRPVRKKHHKHRRPQFTSRVTESFAVEKVSSNPYRDFRESMIDMILKKELFQHSDLEELLKTYLLLNAVELHDLIVRVFTDLWYHLFSIESP